MGEPTLDFESFKRSLNDPHPPLVTNMALRALWYDANGRDTSAHRAAASEGSMSCAGVRAYLHRKAGDESEARIWYWRSGQSQWEGTAASEWLDIVQTIMAEFPVASAYGA